MIQNHLLNPYHPLSSFIPQANLTTGPLVQGEPGLGPFAHIGEAGTTAARLASFHATLANFFVCHYPSHIFTYIWVWVNIYRYIFSGMNIHESQLFWGSPGVQGFDTLPYLERERERLLLGFVSCFSTVGFQVAVPSRSN